MREKQGGGGEGRETVGGGVSKFLHSLVPLLSLPSTHFIQMWKLSVHSRQLSTFYGKIQVFIQDFFLGGGNINLCKGCMRGASDRIL